LLDAETFSTLYREAYPKLVVVAAAMTGDRAVAADVVQQAALIAVERLQTFCPSEPTRQQLEFSRWMTAIVRNVASNTRRRMNIRRATSLHDGDVVSGSAAGGAGSTHQPVTFDSDTRSFDGLEDAFDDRLKAALLSLSELGRICLLLKVVMQLTYDDIGGLLELSPGTVASHVSRSKQSLRLALQENRGEST